MTILYMFWCWFMQKCHDAFDIDLDGPDEYDNED
jgi:hypothetical protein